MPAIDLNGTPHRRKNILTGEWVLVSPRRTDRPWQGELSPRESATRPAYDAECYLCPGNRRANGERNPAFSTTYAFTNDFSALVSDAPPAEAGTTDLLVAKSEKGVCRVITFSPRHDLTLAEMQESEIENIISSWQEEFGALGARSGIHYVQIFENKGQLMGNSNPHPHGQIWAQEHVPGEALKEQKHQRSYAAKKGRGLLSDYLRLELKLRDRVVYENEAFVVLVPFWAVWPYETIVIPRRRLATILQFSASEKRSFANALSVVTIKYDNLFETSFPYSAGLHQAPTTGKTHPEWHLHMHFFPPLLRSASIRKYMVGYELLAEPQRDITPEKSAKVLRELPLVHFKNARSIPVT